MQKDWAQTAMMADPSKGALASFDSGLLTSPPPGLEFGYVPIVIQQFMAPGSTAVTTPRPTTTAVVTPEPTATTTPVAMPEPTATTTSKPLVVVAVLVALLLVVALGLKARKSKKNKDL